MKKSEHKFFAALFLGSIIGWLFFGTSPYPILAFPVFIVWLLLNLYNRGSG
jgi:F0F1-type ATP synthase assembly protein I